MENKLQVTTPPAMPTPQAEPAAWWRKPADEIEAQAARSGSQEAMACYTQMRGLLQAVATPQAEPVPVVASEPVVLLRQALIALESCGAGAVEDGGNQWFDEKLVDAAHYAIEEYLATPQAEPAVAEPGGILGTIKSHPNYVAGFKAGHAAGRARAALASQSTPPPESAGQGLKDHEIAKLVSDLRDVAVSFHGHQSLRERIAYLVRPLAANPTAQPDGGSKA